MTISESALFFMLMVWAVSFTISGYQLRKPVLAFAAAGGWLLFGVFAYTMSAGPWDIYYGIFFVAMGMLIVSALEPILMRERRDDRDMMTEAVLDDFYSDDNDDVRERVKSLPSKPDKDTDNRPIYRRYYERRPISAAQAWRRMTLAQKREVLREIKEQKELKG